MTDNNLTRTLSFHIYIFYPFLDIWVTLRGKLWCKWVFSEIRCQGLPVWILHPPSGSGPYKRKFCISLNEPIILYCFGVGLLLIISTLISSKSRSGVNTKMWTVFTSTSFSCGQLAWWPTKTGGLPPCPGCSSNCCHYSLLKFSKCFPLGRDSSVTCNRLALRKSLSVLYWEHFCCTIFLHVAHIFTLMMISLIKPWTDSPGRSGDARCINRLVDCLSRCMLTSKCKCKSFKWF